MVEDLPVSCDRGGGTLLLASAMTDKSGECLETQTFFSPLTVASPIK